MTEDDIARIEAALGVRLPAAYRQLVVPFPIAAYAGNADTELWDDPAQLIELNRELRAGYSFVRPWPEHMFALGRDDSGSAAAIDLRDPAAPVWWADRCHLDVAGSGQVSSSLASWAEQYIADLREGLEAEEFDPDDPPEVRAKAYEERDRRGCRLILVLIGLGVLLLLVVYGLAAWVSD